MIYITNFSHKKNVTHHSIVTNSVRLLLLLLLLLLSLSLLLLLFVKHEHA